MEGLWYIKGSNESTLVTDLLVPDCPKEMHINSQGARNLAEYRERVNKFSKKNNKQFILRS